MRSGILIVLLVGLTVSISSNAQESHSAVMPKDFTAFSWEISVPTSNKYLNKTSLSGWRLEYRRMIKQNISVGLAVSWSAFDEKIPTKTYASEGGGTAVTTDMIRQVYAVPITAIGHYYFSTGMKLFQPYAGIGLGTQYLENNTYFNIYQLTDNNWGFVARPELGTIIHFGPTSPVKGLLSVGYNWSTNKNEAFHIDNWGHLAVNVGIGVGSF